MRTSDWITIGMSLVTILGTSWVISFKLGGIHNEIKSLSDRVSTLEKQMRKVLRVLTNHHTRIKRLEKVTTKLERVTNKLYHVYYKR